MRQRRGVSSDPLASLAGVRCFASLRMCERARLRAGRRWRSTSGAPPLRAGVPCAARTPRAAAPLALARARRCCAAPLRSELDMLAVAPPHARRRDAPWVAALLGAYHSRQHLPAHGLAGRHRGICRRTPRPLWRGGRYPVGAIYGAASSAGLRAARAARFVGLTRRDCSSATTAGSEASFPARPQTEQRSGVGLQGRPLHHEPPAGTARRAARRLHESGPTKTPKGRKHPIRMSSPG